jgi:hypothetical protein
MLRRHFLLILRELAKFFIDWGVNLKDPDVKICVFIITNLIHKLLVHSHKLYKIKFIYMFRAQSAPPQKVNDANCTYAASGIVILCK